MKVAVPKEIVQGERRVALVPTTTARLVKSGMEVRVESGAGKAAQFSDEEYESAGATIVLDPTDLYGWAGVVLKVQRPIFNQDLASHEVALIGEGTVVIAFLQPLTHLEMVDRLVERRITSFSMDTIPRIARAQSMDALSSMASISGYKSALIAADTLEKYFPMMITAAGTIAPAKGLVLGAGVAGLQAIATSRRLGAVMSAYDVRPAAKEQVESLGATFIQTHSLIEEAEDAGGYARDLSQESQQKGRDLIQSHLKDVDFVITTAAVPGRPAPLLIERDMLKVMRPGSVIVDLSAGMGGNCAATIPGEVVVEHGVIIHGPLNLPSSMATHASQMYARNITNLLLHLVKDGQLHIDFDDEITSGCCITHEGRIIHMPTLALG